MLSPKEAERYERQSNAAAGYCAACTKQLSGETYFCDECASDAYVETDPNGKLTDDEFSERG